MKFRFIRIALLVISVFIVATCLFLYFSNAIIDSHAKDKVFSSIDDIHKNKVGLVLGTSKQLASGNQNLYFTYRVAAAVELYKHGKIDYILVSGDNGNTSYDEPTDFKNELIRLGIPEDKIVLDYAGFRTLDSVIRSKHIFGQTEIR